MTFYVDTSDISLHSEGHQSKGARLFAADAEALKKHAKELKLPFHRRRNFPVLHYLLGHDARTRAVAAGAVQITKVEMDKMIDIVWRERSQ